MTAPAQNKQPSPLFEVMMGIARDMIDAARSGSEYPVIIDSAEPEIVMAVAAGVVRRAAMDSDRGAEHLLTMARDGLDDGVKAGTTTRLEASVGTALLELADPRRLPEVIYDRAVVWSLTRGVLDAIDVTDAAVQMLAFIASMTEDADAFLDGLAAQVTVAVTKGIAKINATTEGEPE